jgi:hypothetical protein
MKNAINEMKKLACVLMAMTLAVTALPCAVGADDNSINGAQAPAVTAGNAVRQMNKFMALLSKLSPVKNANDSDLAQRWPRGNRKRYTNPQTGQVRYMDWEFLERVTNTSNRTPFNGAPWQVDLLGGTLTAGFDENLSSIRWFVDGGTTSALSHEQPPTLENCISEEQAISHSLAYLRAGGIRVDDLRLRWAELKDLVFPPTASGRHWRVQFDRYWRGVPFVQQGLFVDMDGGAGRLLNYGALITALPPPKISAIKISAAKAVKLAGEHLPLVTTASGTVIAGESAVYLGVVLPDTAHAPQALAGTPATALAWIVKTPVTHPRAYGIIETWIDTGTGSILGSEYYGLRGNSEPMKQAHELMHEFASARQVQVKSKSGRLLTLNPSLMQMEYYGAVGAIRPILKTTAAGPASETVHIFVYPKQGKPLDVTLSPSTGEMVDSAGRKAQAGAAFRSVVLKAR